MNAPQTSDRYLAPAETAQRLGISIKALRLYEARGLVRPHRTAIAWRVYGPDEIARLHQILALKRLGLSLARIKEVLGQSGRLEHVLALQEQELMQESTRLSRALFLVRAARAKLAEGRSLSIDDLATLTKETTMTRKVSPETMKAIFEPIAARHFTPEERAALTKRKLDEPEITDNWSAVLTDAHALMADGADPFAPPAMDVARRWQVLVDVFTGGDPVIMDRLRAVWNDALSDPKAAPNLPINRELFAFIAPSLAKLKEAQRKTD